MTPHRPGDLARIDEAATSQAPRKGGKSKASASKDKETSSGIEGVVYKVSLKSNLLTVVPTL